MLNEPKTSLHESLIEPLARLVADAARCSQVIVTSHSAALAASLADHTGQPPIVLRRVNGSTVVST